MHQRVQVAVRVRGTPLEAENCVALDEGKNLVSVRGGGIYAASNVRSYREDVLLGKELSNKAIFERLLLPKLDSANVEHPETLCFFAYGHTNSGKTHTIAGNSAETGILTLCVEELIRKCDIVEVSMVEVYMEAVYDLLAEGKMRQIRRHHGPQGATIVVKDLTTCSIVSLSQWEVVSKYGMRSRRTAATDRNTRSSRSHAVFTLKSKGVRACFVDLAGSERQTLFSPQLNKESISINKSLSRLSTVLEALSMQRLKEDSSRSYVNFRDTVLTVLLQRYLCGASLTTFLACVHPSPEFYCETLSTLRYTQRLKRIQTVVPQPGGPGDVSAIAHSEHQELIEELMRLRQQVREERDNTKAIVQAHLLRIAALEDKLKQQRHAKIVLIGNNSMHQSVAVDNQSRDRALKAKDAKRMMGWLVDRILGSLPPINVGYDEYFDSFFPPKIQVIGYVSTMACLAPREVNDNSLAFLDVGDLSMGLSMVDASIPPFVRLHRVPCRYCAAWDGQELDAQGHMLYILAFFEVNEEAMKVITERENQLECCEGYLSLVSLLPIAIVLCVPTSSPSHVKEAALQWLVALQGKQKMAVRCRMSNGSSIRGGCTLLNASFTSHSQDTDNTSNKVVAINADILMSPHFQVRDASDDGEYHDSNAMNSFSNEMLNQGGGVSGPALTHQMDATHFSSLSNTATSSDTERHGNATKPPLRLNRGELAKSQTIGALEDPTMNQQPSGGNLARPCTLNMQARAAASHEEVRLPSINAMVDLSKRKTTHWRTSRPASCLNASNKTESRKPRKKSRGSKEAVKFEGCKGCVVL